MNKIIKNIFICVLLISILCSTALAYFEFSATKDVEIELNAKIPVAFGRLPTDVLEAIGIEDDTNWGKIKEDPFLIQVPHHLENLKILNNRGEMDENQYYFRLLPDNPITNDTVLDMSEFPPIGGIGTEKFPFKGIFDGNGKTIKNHKIAANSGEIDIGMFGVIGVDAKVHNLILDNITVSSIKNELNKNAQQYLSHLTEKPDENAEDCHIGLLCGHLDGEVYDISVYDSEINIKSPGLDYYSKYGIIGFCGPDAKVSGELVTNIQIPDGTGDGEFGYWYADHIHEFAGQQFDYMDIGAKLKDITPGGYLTGNAPANTDAAGAVRRVGTGWDSTIHFKQTIAIPAYGIFKFHTTDRSWHSDDNIAPLAGVTADSQGKAQGISNIRYVKTNQIDSNGEPTTFTPVNLKANYNRFSNPDEFYVQENIFDPWKAQPIDSFAYGVAMYSGSTGQDANRVDEYTGKSKGTNQATDYEKTTGTIFFMVDRPCKIFCIVQRTETGNPQKDRGNTQLYDIGVNSKQLQPIAGGLRRIPTVNDTNLYLFEWEITQSMINATYKSNEGTVQDPDERANFAIGLDSSTSTRIVYLAVPGAKAGGGHINTQKIKLLPSVDFIYDLAVPVTQKSIFQPSDIIPFFVMGTKGMPNNKIFVSDLSVKFKRRGIAPNITFDMTASGSNATALDYRGNFLFDYVYGNGSKDTANAVRLQ